MFCIPSPYAVKKTQLKRNIKNKNSVRDSKRCFKISRRLKLNPF